MIAGYRAAHEGVAFLRRTSRELRRVSGRAPAQMLTGLLSGSMPPDLESADGTLRGRVPCSTMLTPKGRMVCDLRVARLENGAEGALLLDLPESGLAGAVEHLRTYLPPRMARFEELDERCGVLAVVGPRSAEVLSGELGVPADAAELMDLEEGGERVLSDGSEVGIRVVRSGEVSPPAFDILATDETLRDYRSRLLSVGATEGSDALWKVMRIERGRPAFGVEMDEDTIPMEAGIQDRCIDDRKGCYTGQEVVVRIRDRGHVNRHLRGVLLGDQAEPDPGTPLFPPGGERSVGAIRSSVRSPRFGRGIALAYVRREMEPPCPAALAAPDGPKVDVRELTNAGWVLAEGDVRRHAERGT